MNSWPRGDLTRVIDSQETKWMYPGRVWDGVGRGAAFSVHWECTDSTAILTNSLSQRDARVYVQKATSGSFPVGFLGWWSFGMVIDLIFVCMSGGGQGNTTLLIIMTVSASLAMVLFCSTFSGWVPALSEELGSTLLHVAWGCGLWHTGCCKDPFSLSQLYEFTEAGSFQNFCFGCCQNVDVTRL